MKVLHIIDGLGTGGAEKLVVDTVPLYVNQGLSTDVLLLNGEKTPFYKELEQKNCCKIYALGSSFYNPIYVLKIIPFLAKYDIVHVHLFPAQYFVVLAKMLSFSGVKLVFTEHSTKNRRLNNSFYRLIERVVYRFYEKIICITPQVETVLLNTLNIKNEKLVTILNGINLEKVALAPADDRKKWGYKKEDRILVMVAGFRTQKDQDTLITATTRLPINYKLILVGDGERRPTLERLVQDLQLTERVKFLGIRTDVYSLMKMSDIVILSSHWEGFGLVAAEAMGCGTPVIASNVDGMAQVVENGGILFEKGDVEDLKEKILSLENYDYYKMISNRGIMKAKKYDINRLIKQTISVYKSV